MEFIKVGKVKDAHGLKGELFILLFAKTAPWIKQLKNFNITRESPSGKIETQTLTLKSSRPHKDGLIVVTEEVNDRNHSESLKGFAFEIPKNILVSKKGETPYLIELLGFEVYDSDVLLGSISSFSSNSEQDLLVVESPTRFYEIPFVEPYVLKTDYEARKIMMVVPEGLLELCGYDK